MKIQIIVLSLLLALSASAQKKVVVKKGDIKVDGAVVATYDGKGGMHSGWESLKLNFRGRPLQL